MGIPTQHIETELMASEAPDAKSHRSRFWSRLAAVLLTVFFFGIVIWGWIVTAGTPVTSHRCEPSPGQRDRCVIVWVKPDGPADRAGLKPGDVVLAVNGVPLTEVVTQRPPPVRPGDHISYRVQRAASPGAASGGAGLQEEVSLTITSRLAQQRTLIDLLVASGLGLLGLTLSVIVLLVRPPDPAARLLLLTSTSYTLLQVLATWAWTDLWHRYLRSFRFAEETLLVLTVTAVAHLFLAFPAAHPLLVRLRALGPVWLRPTGGVLVACYLLLVGAHLLLTVPRPVFPVRIVPIALLVLAAMALLRNVRRPPTPVAQAQLKWILWAVLLNLVVIAPQVLGRLISGKPPFTLLWPVEAALNCTVLLAIALSMFRYRLFDIDLIINRTLVYSALSLVLALTYFGGALLFQSLLTPLTQGSEISVAGSTLLVAGIFQPARWRIQDVVDRRFYRRKYDAEKTLEAFSARLRDEIDLDTLQGELKGVVQQTVQPVRVSLWLRSPKREV